MSEISIFFFVSLFVLGFPTPKPPVCQDALGMKDNKIPDSSISASTTWNAQHTPPERGRLEQYGTKWKEYGCWAALDLNTLQWFQVDFGAQTKVTMVATQGCADLYFWTKSYTLAYSNDGFSWEDYKEGDDVKVDTYWFNVLLE